MLDLKKKVEAKTGIVPSEQRLIYGGKQLEDKRCIGDYPPLNNGSTLVLVMRLPGGSKPAPPARRRPDRAVPRSSEPCMITFEEDAHNVLMPCGHTISPDGLMDYCWSEVSGGQRKQEIRCCLCNAEWPLDVLYQYSGASKAELDMLEVGLSKNFCLHSSDIMECPGCESFCERKNCDINCVQCRICSKKKSSSYMFCWLCLQPWKSNPSAKECGNTKCTSTVIQKLHDAPLTSVMGVKVKVPNLRACPKCGTLIELAHGCKHMVCRKCSDSFCFICLRSKSNGSWMCGGYSTECTPAPRQDRIVQPGK